MLTKFKYNHVTKMWSRILLLADGKNTPYQNEVMLTPVQLAGYPRSWKEVAEVNVVKYFHQQLPDDVSYYQELPSDVEKEMLENLDYHIWQLLVKKHIPIIHVALPSGFIVKGETCVVGFKDLIKPFNTMGNDELGNWLKHNLFGKEKQDVQ